MSGSFRTDMPPRRVMKTPVRGPDGLIVEPKDSDPQTLLEEVHNRQRFAKKANYADPFEGDGRTIDPNARYNCGSCNQQDDGNCAFWFIDGLNLAASSCADYENECAGDPEVRLRLPNAVDVPDRAERRRQAIAKADFGTAKNGVGFGCMRCPRSKKSERGPDSLGRPLWCGEGGFRVMEAACCKFNAAETVDD